MSFSLRSQDGFTLVEIMLTLVVLGLGIMLLFQVITTLTTVEADTENRVIALHLVVEKAEELKSLGFTHSDLDPGTHTDSVFIGFTRQWIVMSYQGSDTDQLKQIRVTVSWTDKAGGTLQSVDADTLMVNLTWAGS
ncbi:MAG: prepilin-type N-terminal cleavage/methylation domain-containing protein [bacterium]